MLSKPEILRLMRESGLSAPYPLVKEFVRLYEALKESKQ
jgi:hypothetical protein